MWTNSNVAQAWYEKNIKRHLARLYSYEAINLFYKYCRKIEVIRNAVAYDNVIA